MHFEHRIDVAASNDEVWEFLWHADRIGACLPGCREVRTIEPYKRYEATIEERIGPFKAHFDWEITVEEQEPLQRIRLSARGKDAKLGATARVEMLILMAGSDQGRTMLEITTDLLITGKVATLGATVIKRKADQVVGEFARTLRVQLEQSAGEREHA